MYTRCPSCLTCFRATEHHLAIAGGKVRCGQCQLVFNATEHAIDDLPANQLSKPASATNEVDTHETDATEANIIQEITRAPEDNKPVEEEQVNTKSDFDFELGADDVNHGAEPSNEDWQPTPFDEPENKLSENSASDEEDNVLDKERLHNENKKESKEEKDQQLSIDMSEQISDQEFEILDIDDEIIDEEQTDNSEELTESNVDKNDDNDSSKVFEEIESEATYNGESFEIINPKNTLENTTATEQKTEDDVPVQLRDDIERLQQPAARRVHPALSLIFILVLLTISLLQLAYFRAFELTFAVPSATPYIEMFCEKVSCHYSGPLDKKKIQLLSRDVRVHPKEKNALLISAAMINNAHFAQPYPNIKIRLSDISGNVVAERIFTAKTYMGNATNPFSLMKSKIPVHIKFEVVDPGKDAVNFEFDFI